MDVDDTYLLLLLARINFDVTMLSIKVVSEIYLILNFVNAVQQLYDGSESQ